MSDLFYTYLHRRSDTGDVFYVGKGRRRRAYTSSGRSSHWNRIAAKHGFTIEIVALWESESAAFEHEVFLIKVLREMGCALINKTTGGEGSAGTLVDEVTRSRMREAQARLRLQPGFEERRIAAMTRSFQTPEHRAAVSIRMQKHRGSDSARVKQSSDTKNAWLDPESRARRIASMRANAAKPEVATRLAKISRERAKNPESVARSVAHMIARNAAAQKPVECLTTGQKFASCKEAAEALGVKPFGIREVCLGYYTKTRGLRFRYASILTDLALAVPPPPGSGGTSRR